MQYKVWMRSTPGMFEQYNGYVKAYGNNDNEAIQNAFKELRKTFPHRTREMWQIEKVERIY